ncbi:hypothetical protein AJ80_00029 [Polytolypa hystricis UAMH7299]|uniref:Esterase n=1 Tax=Polytolypa hystricis (strain UAMH7299) TaxID=1447883 RepID=A0A2B7Z4G3_POLH7|nr:hypothetical protein AJ80_00029 [Polytolypa hystricis UAMH7299]
MRMDLRFVSVESPMLNAAVWKVCSSTGLEYQIQVSWPLKWNGREDAAGKNIFAIYLVDGNSLFLSASEIVRRPRPRYEHRPEAIIVAIGYPLTDSVFSPRRQFDFTPPSLHSCSSTGESQPHGGAEQFLDFIEHVVRPFISSLVFPIAKLERSALFGHSLGGLLTLHALFTRPKLFNTFLAASPSIWWNERFILHEEARFIDPDRTIDGGGESSLPALRLSYGSLEQFPRRHRNLSAEEYENVVRHAAERRMTDNCKEMYKQLRQSDKLRDLEIREYADEDHGSVTSAALS